MTRIGLGRRELRAWAMYDWANSAFQTTIIAAIFPPFFASFAAAGLPPSTATARFAWATTIAVAITAVVGPVLGAIADLRARKKLLLSVCAFVGVVATALMTTISRGDWLFAASLFVVGNVAVAASFVFYDSLLPHIASPSEIDRVSTAGYAVGYLGGGALLVLNLAWILSPTSFGLGDTLAATKLSFASVAVWWLLFTIPLLIYVREPLPLVPRTTPLGNPFRQSWQAFGELRHHRQAFLMLVAFLLYNDGIQTIIRMAAIYGAEVGIDQNAQIAAFVVVQVVGVPFSFLFGSLATKIGAKQAIFLSLAVYTGISVLGYFMASVWQFFALAFLVGTVQGGSQALSRSMFARMIPKQKSSEYFGFFSVFEKFAGIAGPAVFALSVSIAGSSRLAVLSVILFFIAGAMVLLRVDLEAGEREAQQREGDAL